MLRNLRVTAQPFRHLLLPEAKPYVLARRRVSCSLASSTLGAFHEIWRIRVLDSVQRRSYAIDVGNFPGSWFLGPSTSLTISRSDDLAGRPNSFKHAPKNLATALTSALDLSHDVDLSAADDSVCIELSGKGLNARAQTYGAALTLTSPRQSTENQTLSKITALQHKSISSLNSQSLRLPVFYSFDHPAGYHEEGSAFAHVQRVWGDSIVPEWLSCLGYHFGSNGFIETILDVTLAGGPFAVGYHSPTLHWYLVDSDPGVEVDTQVEAEYGRLKINVQQASKKLVITASAPHRTFDLLTLPTTQGFQDKGIQTFSGTATVEAFEHERLIDSQVIDGLNLQFGAAYAARTVQRMTAQQYSSPLRVKGKGVTK
ncbi:hypothetical protein WJX79_000042 [Trebouxia sp. C0005]